MAKIKRRVFKILDIDCEVIVEVVSSQKEIFSFMDEYLDNLPYDWFDYLPALGARNMDICRPSSLGFL